jgi:hypothetical protein
VEFSKRFDPIYSKYILGFPAAMEKLEESYVDIAHRMIVGCFKALPHD